jgi:phage anti-repressor protein
MIGDVVPVVSGEINGERMPMVNLRDLHVALGVGRDFSNWVKARIAKYDFCQNQDFVITEVLRSPDLASAKSRAQIALEYHATLDMAKELAMVENNDRGRSIRRYFIEIEKSFRLGTVPSSNVHTLSAYEMRTYTMLLSQVRLIYGTDGAKKLYHALPLPQVNGGHITRMAEPLQSPSTEYDVNAVEAREALDGIGCLSHLMKSEIGRGHIRIADCLFPAKASAGLRMLLSENGLFVNPAGHEGHVAVADKHPRLSRIFALTAWAPDWRVALLTLVGAYSSGQALDFPAGRRKATLVPMQVLATYGGG